MVRSRVLLSAFFATLVVVLSGCAAPLSRGYYAGGYPYGVHGYYCGEWRVWPGGFVCRRWSTRTGVSPARAVGSVGLKSRGPD